MPLILSRSALSKEENMELYKIDISTSGAFYSPIKGDMFFGMFCSVLADYQGTQKLENYLEGYTENRPFIVFSDAFPKGYLPKPCLPGRFFSVAAADRKEAKRKTLFSIEQLSASVNNMEFIEGHFITPLLKTGNHVNPLTSHADGREYSAFISEQFYYNGLLTLYILIDENRISPKDVESVIHKMGQIGFGKKATSGAGKFLVENSLQKIVLPKPEHPNALLTLSPCVPQKDTFKAEDTYYKVFVRFGKHGGVRATSSTPFKKPVLMMDSGAVLCPINTELLQHAFVGCGLDNVSLSEERCFFQGYSPVVPISIILGE
jgi:CRISPR-associated protein Csm4